MWEVPDNYQTYNTIKSQYPPPNQKNNKQNKKKRKGKEGPIPSPHHDLSIP
jgi:hypothetical protein